MTSRYRVECELPAQSSCGCLLACAAGVSETERKGEERGSVPRAAAGLG